MAFGNKALNRRSALLLILLQRRIKNKVCIIMNGRGRVFNNIFIEPLWRTVKYDNIYVHEYERIKDVCEGLKKFFDRYNMGRIHQSLEYQTPWRLIPGLNFKLGNLTPSTLSHLNFGLDKGSISVSPTINLRISLCN